MPKFLLIFLFVFSFTACSPSNQDVITHQQTSYPLYDNNQIYPIIETQIDTSAYPSENPTASIAQGPTFVLHSPIRSGDTVVSGSGPSNVPIILVDVSDMGEKLGETKIDQGGNFIFVLELPLQGGHSIGLQLGDVSNTEFNERDFLFSESYYERPYIGILFDIANVK